MTDNDNSPEDVTGPVPTRAEPPARLRLSWGGATHPGAVRPANEDALFADRGLFVVADGMGGHQAGEVASRISVKTLAGGDHSSVDQLVAGVSAANDAVWDHALSGPEFKGMGTTLTALAVIGDGSPPMLGLVNVGDSRAYRLRDGQLGQLTDDHSYVAELVRRGQISESDAATHPYRNMVTRAIGVAATVDVDSWELVPEPGDVFLLCSDGLVDELAEPKILELLVSNDDPTETAKALISAANDAGGRDNITVVIVKVDSEHPPSEAPEAPTADVSPLDTGVISPVSSASEVTAELEALPSHLDETTAALEALTEVAEDIGEPELVPPSKPADALAEYDLPVLDGDEASLPWLTEPADAEVAAVPTQPAVTDVARPEPATPVGEDDPAHPQVPAPPAPESLAAELTQAPEPSEPAEQIDPESDVSSAATQVPTQDIPTRPMSPFVDPVTASGPVDHFAPAVRGWKAPVAVTWRSLLFVSVVLAVIIGAGALVGWYARSAYYVGFAGDEVVVYQGRPDGVLWFDPTLEEGTGLFRQDLPASTTAEIEGLFETGTLEGARSYIAEIRPGQDPGSAPGADDPVDDDPADDDPVGATTTTLS